MEQNTNLKTLKIFHWSTYLLTLLILPLNFGIGLFGMAIIIIPLLISRIQIGRKLHLLQKHKFLLILSALNFLTFALIRPDGAHALTDTGYTALLQFLGINIDYNRKLEEPFFILSILLLFLQMIFEIWLRKLVRRNENPTPNMG